VADRAGGRVVRGRKQRLGRVGEPDHEEGHEGRRHGPGAGVHGDAAVDVFHSCCDDVMFLGLVEGEELAGGAEDEDSVDAAGELSVDVPPQSVQVDLLVRSHRRDHGRNDARKSCKHGGFLSAVTFHVLQTATRLANPVSSELV
jgi:hypothetical protein